jgi:hypothetical protein
MRKPLANAKKPEIKRELKSGARLKGVSEMEQEGGRGWNHGDTW